MRKLIILLGKPFTLLLKSLILSLLFVSQISYRPPHFRHIIPVFLFLGGVGLSLGVYAWFLSLPSLTLLEHPPSQTTMILDRHNRPLYAIYRDENRTLVRLTELPPHLLKATLAIEDKNFFSHHGIDVGGILRAFLKNLVNCRLYTTPCVEEGGSTLTQQLVKNTLLTHEKTLDRKLKEAVLALLVEQHYTKEQILELYLNEVNYGGATYGIAAASTYYFNKSPRDLTLGESALLAGLTVAPTTLSPLGSHPYLTKDRQLYVLAQMTKNGFIEKSEEIEAAIAPLSLRPQNISLEAPHFVMWLKEQLVATYGEELINEGGLTITTTLDLDKQRLLEQEIRDELARLGSLQVRNGAGLITNPQTGEILAMVGSQNYYDTTIDGQVNLTTSPRQPGSSIKPFTYALALMNGLTPETLIDDAPICFPTSQEPYCPKNYDGRFHGPVPLRVALGSSYNIPAVKLLNGLGVTKLVNFAQQLGITTWENPSRFGLSLTLGSGEVTMLDMATAYGTLANGGNRVARRAILSIRDSQGNFLPLPTPAATQNVVPASVAYQINRILSDNINRQPAFGPNSVLNLHPYEVAVKTGTTNNLRDNWTFGYTPTTLVATWVGNNDNTPMSRVASGITGASPIWRKTMEKLIDHNAPPTFPVPETVTKVAICRETHLAYCANLCASRPIYAYFVKGTEPKINCHPPQGAILDTAATN